MKILLVVQNYFPFIGGVETHASQVAQEISKTDTIEVVASNFAPYQKNPRFAVLGTSLLVPPYESRRDGSVTVHALTPRPIDRLRMLPIAIRVVPRLQRVAYHTLNRFGYQWYRNVYLNRLYQLTEGVDVVHSLAGGYLGWTAQAAAAKRNIPFVCTPFVHPNQWGDGPEDVEYYQKAQAVIGLVETDRQYLCKIGVPRERTHVIGVSPDLPLTSDPDGFRKRHNLEGVPVVLYVGRMMPQKGAGALLASAPKVWEQLPETRYIFIGPANPEEAKKFEGSDPRIMYLGKVSMQEKADALAACDIFSMPSMSEILPTVYLEAWSLGKVVVGGMAHGLPELVEGNGAGLVAAQEGDAIANALIRLLGDAELRRIMGERGRQLVANQYSVPAVTQSLLGLYRNVVAERK